MTQEELKQGDRVTVKIIQLNEEGDGLAIQEGYVFFVSDTLPGQTVDVEITRISGKTVYTKLKRTQR